MKVILVPIDFGVASLNCVKLALEKEEKQAIRVLLMYAQYTGDSITELLFHSPERIIRSKITKEFNEAIEIIRNRFSHAQIQIKLFQGLNNKALQNFLEANHVDAIYLPKSYSLHCKQRAFNPSPLLRKSGLPVYEMDWENSIPNYTKSDQLKSIFNLRSLFN
jgi:hypothetical protein